MKEISFPSTTMLYACAYSSGFRFSRCGSVVLAHFYFRFFSSPPYHVTSPSPNELMSMNLQKYLPSFIFLFHVVLTIMCFSCNECPKVYATLDSLRKHCRKKHMKFDLHSFAFIVKKDSPTRKYCQNTLAWNSGVAKGEGASN